MCRVKSRLALALMALVAVGFSAACRKEGASAPAASSAVPAGVPAAASASVDLVGGGRYLVTVMACNDCHTPFKMGKTGPEPDMSRMLSGHPEGMKDSIRDMSGSGPVFPIL